MAKRHWLENKLQSFAQWYADITGIGGAHDLWKTLDRYRHDKWLYYKAHFNHKWEDHIYLSADEWETFVDKIYLPPRNEVIKLIENDYDIEKVSRLVIQEFSMMAPWRACKDIAVFDRDLLDQLKNTELGDTLPSDIIMSLPSWSIYF